MGIRRSIIDTRGFRQDIQGLRAVAVALVVVYHLFPKHLSGGFVGVDVFFVISGFLISGHLLREVTATGRVDVPRFWLRRARRLLPAAVVVILAVAAIALFVVPMTAWRELGVQTFASLFYFENWRLALNADSYTAAAPSSSPFQHFWSLSVEEQFYIFWPFVFLVMALFARRGRGTARGRTLTLVVVAAIAGVSFAYSVWFTDHSRAAAYFVTPTRIWELAAGALLAFVPVQARLGVLWTEVLRWGGLGAIAATALLYTDATPFPGSAALVPVLGAAAFVLAGSTGTPVGHGSPLSWRPVQRTGDVSYSLYLWHWPLIVLTTTALDRVLLPLEKIGILGLSVALASLSYAYVENRWRARPVRRHAPPRRPRRLLTAASGLAVLAVAVSGAALITVPQRVADQAAANAGERVGAAAAVRGDYATTTIGGPVPAPVGASQDNWTADHPDCQQKLGRFTGLTTCQVGAPDADADLRVALVGDSHAGHWEPAVEEIADQQDWAVTTYVRSACPITTVRATGSSDHDDACSKWNDAVLTDLAAKHYDAVIVASASYTAFPRTARSSPEEEAVTGYSGAWDRMQATGARVVALEDNPDPTAAGIADIDACVSEHADDLGPCLFPRPGDDADPQVEAGSRAEVPVVDTTDFFCNNRVCSPIIGGVLVYQDRTHITATYADSIAPFLGKRLVPLVNG